MASKNIPIKEKHGWNIRNGFQKCLLKRKTRLEYKEWLPKMSLKKKNMVGKDKHGTNYERKTRVLY